MGAEHRLRSGAGDPGTGAHPPRRYAGCGCRARATEGRPLRRGGGGALVRQECTVPLDRLRRSTADRWAAYLVQGSWRFRQLPGVPRVAGCATPSWRREAAGQADRRQHRISADAGQGGAPRRSRSSTSWAGIPPRARIRRVRAGPYAGPRCSTRWAALASPGSISRSVHRTCTRRSRPLPAEGDQCGLAVRAETAAGWPLPRQGDPGVTSTRRCWLADDQGRRTRTAGPAPGRWAGRSAHLQPGTRVAARHAFPIPSRGLGGHRASI